MSPIAPAPNLARHLRRFAREEDGSMVVFGLFVTLITFVTLGLAVDAMRAEYERTRLQSTCDGAVLAATDLDQPHVPGDVVRSYFDAAGLGATLDGPARVDQSLNSRTVRASASEELPTAFLHMVGHDSFALAADCAATETIPLVEISLVIDVSGSMRFGTSNGLADRIGPLRDASREFARTVLRDARADYTTISIVPYAGQVNPGPELFGMVGGTRRHGHSECIVLEPAEFRRAGLPQESSRQVPHFMNWTIHAGTMDWGWCPQARSAILPFSNDLDAIDAYVEGLRLHDGTGTHIGMKWGLALLDPTSRDEVAALRAAGVAGAGSTDRPVDWDHEDTLKVIVLMTDGNITEQVTPRYDVPVFWHRERAAPLALLEPNADYRTLHDSGRGVDAEAAMADLRSALDGADRSATSVGIGIGIVRMTGGVDAGQMHDMLLATEANPDGGQDGAIDGGAAPTAPPPSDIVLLDHGHMNLTTEIREQRDHRGAQGTLASQTSSGDANRGQFTDICNAAKARGVMIYTVAFEASTQAQAEMRECASADSHFFDVRDREISTAFRAIASQINELRLVQ